MNQRRPKISLPRRWRQSSIVQFVEAIVYEHVLRHLARENAALTQEILDRFVRFCDLENDMLLLDVACGPGRITRALAGQVNKAVALDYSPFMLRYAERNAQEWKVNNISYVLGNGFNLPFPENFFDCVISTNAFVVGQTRAYQEMIRVLKPLGKIICSVPFSYGSREIAKNFYKRNRVKGLHLPIRAIFKFWEWKLKRTMAPLRIDEFFLQLGLQEIAAKEFEEGFIIFAKATKPASRTGSLTSQNSLS